MVGFMDVSRYLDQKYANLGLIARSQAAENFAKAGLLGAQAQQFGPTAETDRRLTGATAELKEMDVLDRRFPKVIQRVMPTAEPENAGDRVGSTGANPGLAGAPAKQPSAATDDNSSYQRVIRDLMRQRSQGGQAPGYAKGVARVPGKGDGTKDTVKAKLAPGEAVLNKAAAEGMGRGLIAALNKMGAKKMGMI